ncbi:hypothetical protein [Kineococcus sp. SYSU DK001]|uniref:hypothetical protein n=1 Tax=Kineococcus sp. SYSU DK001 TaxID=3383122 RepID=UPI003D7D1131
MVEVRERFTGRGPVTVEVRPDPLRSQLVLRDDGGVVEVLPIRPDVLPRVRQGLHEDAGGGTGGEACRVELRDDDGTVRERWGTFTGPGGAAAVGLALLAADRHADHAVVLDAAGRERGELRAAARAPRRA